MGGRGAYSKSGGAEIPSVMVGMDINDAMKNTNPNFNQGIEYQINCQRCVYAYEMNRRGINCTAKPAIISGTDDYMTNNAWSHTMNGRRWSPVGSRSVSKTAKNIEDEMHKYGDGSRAIVCVIWKKGKMGHVFNVENAGGKIIYVDAQKGYRRDINKTLSAAKPTKTLILRIDDLNPNTVLLDKAIERK